MEFNYETTPIIKNHTLLKICRYAGIKAEEYNSNNLFIFKEMLHKKDRQFFLLFSHLNKPVKRTITVKLLSNFRYAFDLATGDKFPLKSTGNGWYKFNIICYPRAGRYLSFER